MKNLTSTAFFSTVSLFKSNAELNGKARDIIFKFNESLYRVKTRLDSYRVFVQAVSSGENDSSALSLLSSVVPQVDDVIDALAMESILWEVTENDEEIDFIAGRINEFSASDVMDNRSLIIGDSARLCPALRKIVSPEAALFISFSVARRFIDGLDLSHGGDLSSIVRELNFPPAYQQAGISILNYFSEIVKDRYPNISVTISIKQQSDYVTMIITLPDGSKEEVTKTLHDYGLVISGSLRPRDVTTNEIKAFALQQKLELAQLEIKQTREILQLERKYTDDIISSLRLDVAMLRDQLGRELSSSNDLKEKLFNLAKDLSDGHVSQRMVDLLQLLAGSVDGGDKGKALAVLEDLKKSEPDVFEKIHNFIFQAAASGIIGNSATEWLRILFTSLPR
ncbi:hypothetical protein [Chromobacterium vaccinii]|uniref:hypothetical protein n=1 Tax=Chromobacterium vaccinii TaxID=1108595 RepID=UPI0011862F87|nr:hypothetical protein [Chromobacterium vaccinii]